MRRVSQQTLVQVDDDGIRIPDTPPGDCYQACVASIFELPLPLAPGYGGNSQSIWDWLALNYPGIGMVARSWVEPKDPEYRQGYWIATIISDRFREPDCGHCRPENDKSEPPFYWTREECPHCEGGGHQRGLHAVVMENRVRVWDPHPEADWDAPLRIVGETFFVVTDPARLSARTVPLELDALIRGER